MQLDLFSKNAPKLHSKKQRVFWLLRNRPETRALDEVLYRDYMNYFCEVSPRQGSSAGELWDWIIQHKFKFEGIRRARQLLQNEFPELNPPEKVQEKREEKRREYEKFVRKY